MKSCILQICSLLIVFITLSGCTEENPLKLKQGDQLYNYYCKQCHIKSGVGAQYEHLPKDRKKMADYEIILMIKHGYSMGHQMPVFTQLSDEQADAIAEYVAKIQ
ncbi:cytochrome c [Neptunomonas sp.]|uniref:c-type cytochrome n=1 Tax=Neptunomonas sp. TaxID=1971898 RepID=UPI0025F7F470|nr:cytochrome c [Neptunomonas sp.]